MMSPIELLKCCYQFGFLITLAQQLCSEHFPRLHEVLIIWTGSGITDLLWNVNAVYWCRRVITAEEWKANNGKIEVIPFVVKPSSKLSNLTETKLTGINFWKHTVHEKPDVTPDFDQQKTKNAVSGKKKNKKKKKKNKKKKKKTKVRLFWGTVRGC